MAGSGIRGAFEEKFKALIRDIEAEVRVPTSSYFQSLIQTLKVGNTICFIDELRKCTMTRQVLDLWPS